MQHKPTLSGVSDVFGRFFGGGDNSNKITNDFTTPAKSKLSEIIYGSSVDRT
jgi:hypothetical protein